MLGNPGLVEHALRQTLVADALSLQFRLPPPSLPPPAARSLPNVAGKTPVVDALVLTSVWAVQILRMLCQVTAAVVPRMSTCITSFCGVVSQSFLQMPPCVCQVMHEPLPHEIL